MTKAQILIGYFHVSNSAGGIDQVLYLTSLPVVVLFKLW